MTHSENTYVFATLIGSCSIAWTSKGITHVEINTRERTTVTAAPQEVLEAAKRIANHLAGACDDLADIEVDLSACPPFTQKVYRALRTVKPGETVTYGEIAKRVGSPGAARAVGRAVAANPVPLIIPCHRVVASNGKLGGFSARGGTNTKKRLLKLEAAY